MSAEAFYSAAVNQRPDARAIAPGAALAIMSIPSGMSDGSMTE
jgi:hypothetical protein